MQVKMVGDGLTLDEEMAYLATLYRESVIKACGKKDGKERYKAVVKAYKNPFLRAIAQRGTRDLKDLTGAPYEEEKKA